jgi:energy-converting hydrogenase A subunit R
MSARKAPKKPKKVFISDCEGPISKNDNAFEVTSHFIPNGARLFTSISRYDDIQADIVKRKGYKAGDTLKLILPFLRAYDLSNSLLTVFSSRNLLLMSGAKEMLESVSFSMPSYIVSTSYEQYMRALCNVVGFPYTNVHCTLLDLDKYEMDDQERAEVKRLAEEIIKLPMLEILGNAQSLEDSPKKLQNTVRRLDEIFWEELSSMKAGRMLLEVNPMGGSEKAAAITEITSELDVSLDNVMYVGDSITDAPAFQFVRSAGGLTVSFNGNSYAVREAEIVVLSRNAAVTALLADTFNRLGRSRLLTLTKQWKPSVIAKSAINRPLKEYFLKACKKGFPKVELVTKSNMARLMRESTEFRKSVRGESIGQLG